MTLSKERQGEIAFAMVVDDISAQLSDEPLTLEKAEITVESILKSKLFMTNPTITYAELIEFYKNCLLNKKDKEIFEQAIINEVGKTRSRI